MVGFFIGVVVMDHESAPDLPDLTLAERDLVRRFPLPVGQPDALVNKKLLAAALDVSATTIDSWLMAAPDPLPYHTKGTNGAAYQFRLSVAYAWRQNRDAAEAADRKFSEDAAAQMRLTLLGGSATDSARAALPLKEQREALAVEAEHMKASRLRRDLIPAPEVALAFEKSFAAIRDGLDAAPDRLARELNLGGGEVETIQKILDDILHNARGKVETLLAGG